MHPAGTRSAAQGIIFRSRHRTNLLEALNPWETGFIESFNARRRDELPNGEIFYSLKEARTVIEAWRRHCNAVRRHAFLGYHPPVPGIFALALATWLSARPQPAPSAALPLARRPRSN